MLSSNYKNIRPPVFNVSNSIAWADEDCSRVPGGSRIAWCGGMQ